MSWIMQYSTVPTYNMGPHSSGAMIIFNLKELLKAAGWSVLTSSDGTTYNAAGDQITSGSSGANGMDNVSAWFRIEDPGSRRELVFQRKTNSYTWMVHYSALDKFIGGSPSATVLPTATDMKGLIRGLDTALALFPTTGNWYVHIAAQNEVEGNVYAFWCSCITPTTGAPKTFISMEPMDSTFSPSGDDDPVITYASDDLVVCGSLSRPGFSETSWSWMRYNEANEEWNTINTIYYQRDNSAGTSVTYCPVQCEANPKTGEYPLLPILWARGSGGGTVTGWKGMGKFWRWKPSSLINYTDILKFGSAYYLVVQDLALPGWPDSTVPLI